MHAISKYLARWTEPEAAFASKIEGPYARTLVVPACREVGSLLDGYADATTAASGRTLVILVVNGPDDGEGAAENAALLDAVRARATGARDIAVEGCRGFAGSHTSSCDVLVVDRASPGARVPRKEGVGLARKIGADVALALHARGRVASRFIFNTDADATLPESYFDVGEVETYGRVAALVFPFWHDAGADTEIATGTALYELSLRYYVAGLAWAGSPYAFHTLGSATAVSVEAYAAVRGFPKRAAAEDFYLLNKVAKVGSVVRTTGPTIRLRSRSSDRTPFGTGASLTSARERFFYPPECFSALKTVLTTLTSFATHGSVERLFIDLRELGPRVSDAVLDVFEQFDGRDALAAVSREVDDVAARLERVHVWFDAFRTLKAIHTVRAIVPPNESWKDTLERAPFAPKTASGSDVDELRRAFMVERSYEDSKRQ